MRKSFLKVGMYVAYQDRIDSGPFKAEILDILPGPEGIVLNVEFLNRRQVVYTSGKHVICPWEEFLLKKNLEMKDMEERRERLRNIHSRAAKVSEELKKRDITNFEVVSSAFFLNIDDIEKLLNIDS